MAKISVKFCGNCSPRIEAWQLYQDVIGALPGHTFVMWKDDENPDILLVINSCRAACATVPGFSGPTVTASPALVNRRAIDEEELLEAILAEVGEAGAK